MFQFPFGQPLTKVEQKDRSPKKVFVLGVYASAVHAKWIGPDGKQKVAALAVASEPSIFWNGENTEELINRIKVPKEAGTLSPANERLNGPSGRALDELFLNPLGFTRADAWLCDLLPESRMNEQQAKAIQKHYTSLVQKFGLSEATIPPFSKDELNDPERRKSILKELEASKAETIILLGDLPVSKFLRYFIQEPISKLSDLCSKGYGMPIPLSINNKSYRVIGLCHPRQAARLGSSSKYWGDLHDEWIKAQEET